MVERDSPRSLSSTDLKRLHRSWRQRPHPRLALVLDDVQNPYNVGSIVRTAAAERVDVLWVTERSAPVRDRSVQKSAMGTDRYLDVRTVADGPAAVAAARADGFRVAAVELAQGAVPLPEAALEGDVCLVVGHEDRGVAKPTLDAVDLAVYVPQLGRVGSLNVAHAAAIALYETRRRAWV